MPKNKLINNILITISGKFGVMAIQLFTTIILARFLSPEDFGIVAMCSIFLSISDMLVDSGMAGSIIFFRDVKEVELHTLFWTNFIVACGLYFILFFSSGLIANFYRVEILSEIIKVIGLSTVIHSLCIIQSTVLSKQLKFKTQSKVLLLSALASSIVVLIIGYYKGGVWTLVWQAILIKFFQVIFFYVFGDYKPKFQYSIKEIKRHWKFGSRLLGISMLRLIYDNIYVQTIGRVVNFKDAGYYAQAKRFNDVPTNLISYPLERVIFPYLASREDKVSVMKSIYKGFTLLLIPLFLLGALVSNELIMILLGEKWIDSGWILSFLFYGTIGISLESLNRNFIKSTGQTNKLFKSDVYKRILNLVILSIGVIFSLRGILIAFIFNGFLGWIINSIVLGGITEKFSIRNQIRQVVYSIVISSIPFICITLYYNKFTSSVGYLGTFFYKIAFFIFLYFILLILFERNIILKGINKFSKGRR